MGQHGTSLLIAKGSETLLRGPLFHSRHARFARGAPKEALLGEGGEGWGRLEEEDEDEEEEDDDGTSCHT